MTPTVSEAGLRIAGKQASRVIQGTAGLGLMPEQEAMRLLDGVYEHGCTAFDTAHQYDDGDSERMLGRWLRARDLYGEVLVVTKGAHPSRDRQRVTPYDIAADLEDSRARLGTDTVDLYLLHRDDPTVPVATVVDALSDHLAGGRVHAYGLSNWSHERIVEATAYARENGLPPPAASSPHFSLAVQNEPPWEGCVSISGPSDAAARAFYRTTQMPVLAWSSLAGGLFAIEQPDGDAAERGAGTNTPSADPSMQVEPSIHVVYGNPTNDARRHRARQLAEQKGLTPVQIVLLYVLSQPMNTFAIAGCRTPEEYASLAAAAEGSLSEDEVAWLESGG